MGRHRVNFFFLNLGHFFDHLFILIFATAVLKLAIDWEMSYPDLLPYAAPGMVAFGVGAIPAGWIADKWNRHSMIVVFFIGIGVASIATSLATTPMTIGAGLFAIGIFASIYHPVGIAMVVQGRAKTGMPLALNGVFGNLGVAAAPLLTGALVDLYDWKLAFVIPGVISISAGVAYWIFAAAGSNESLYPNEGGGTKAAGHLSIDRQTMIRVFPIIFFTTAVGGLIFQSTTYTLPKIFEERLGGLATSITAVGMWAFFVFTMAAFAQLVVGYLVDRHSIRTVFAAVAGIQAILFLVMVELTGAAALIVSLGFMLVVFGQIPINDVLVGRVAKDEWRSRAFAARSFITFSVMSITLPTIAWMHANWGFWLLFIAMCICAAIIFLAVLQLPRVAAVTGAEAPAE